MINESLLARADRAVLLVPGAQGAADVRPLPCAAWWDGAGMWLGAGSSVDAGHGGVEDGPVWLVVPSPDASAPLLVRGRLRVYSVRDPVRLLLHAATVSGALSASALRGGTRLPLKDGLARVMVERTFPALPVPQAAGVAPALPPSVPAQVRRALAGVRTLVAVVGTGDGGLTATPATWSAGQRVEGVSAPAASVAVLLDSGGSPARSAGLLLRGHLDGDGRLSADHAAWWTGTGPVSEAPVAADPATFTLPE